LFQLFPGKGSATANTLPLPTTGVRCFGLRWLSNGQIEVSKMVRMRCC